MPVSGRKVSPLLTAVGAQSGAVRPAHRGQRQRQHPEDAGFPAPQLHQQRGGVPLVRCSEIDRARPHQAERRARVVLHVEVGHERRRQHQLGPLARRPDGVAGGAVVPVLGDGGRQEPGLGDLLPADRPLAVRLDDPLHPLDEGGVLLVAEGLHLVAADVKQAAVGEIAEHLLGPDSMGVGIK